MATKTNTTVGADAHYAKAGFPPFQTEQFAGQIFWFALAFGALYLMISKIAAPRIASILETREATIAGSLEAASKAQKQAEQASAAYEQALATAKANAQTIAQESRNSSAAATETKRQAAEASLNEKMVAAEKTIAAARAAAMSNVAGIAKDAAGDIVKQITGKAATAAELQAAL